MPRHIVATYYKSIKDTSIDIIIPGQDIHYYGIEVNIGIKALGLASSNLTKNDIPDTNTYIVKLQKGVLTQGSVIDLPHLNFTDEYVPLVKYNGKDCKATIIYFNY